MVADVVSVVGAGGSITVWDMKALLSRLY